MGEGRGGGLGPHLEGQMFTLLKALDLKVGLFC